jgi:O-antigen ligase
MGTYVPVGVVGRTSQVALPRAPDAPGWIRATPGWAALVLLAVGVAQAAYMQPVRSPAFLLAAGCALLALLALALARYETAVALGFLLLGFVTTDPAPADAVFAVVIVVAMATGRFELGRVPAAVSASIAVLVALNLLSALEAVDAALVASFFATTLYLAVFAIWLAGYVTSRRRARSVALPYIAAATVSALLGSLALLAPIPERETLLLGGCCRAKALFQDPNVFGPFLIPAALILMQELVAARRLPRGAWLRIALIGLLLLGVVLSFSRAAWLNLGVSAAVLVAVLLLRRRGPLRAAALVGTLLAVGALAGAVVVTSGATSFLEQRAALQGYDAERFAAQRTGIELAERYPLGIGPGQFEAVVPVPSHNTYIRVLAEQGILGLGALLGLWLTTLAIGARNAALGRDTYGIGSAALLAAWCGLLVNSIFVDTLHWRHLWLVAALIWAGAWRAASTGQR